MCSGPSAATDSAAVAGSGRSEWQELRSETYVSERAWEPRAVPPRDLWPESFDQILGRFAREIELALPEWVGQQNDTASWLRPVHFHFSPASELNDTRLQRPQPASELLCPGKMGAPPKRDLCSRQRRLPNPGCPGLDGKPALWSQQRWKLVDLECEQHEARPLKAALHQFWA
eukprot:TRINITY_DN17638_c0_g2_i1.p2 TRINITY_DN17638_c0_g2~~TRINITY_DN17638_c0_g2_i1.p2  ORF type:complete len:173 (-),score=16.87 TRINITY_DN17638_c0_g2_i1:666-1184(-)